MFYEMIRRDTWLAKPDCPILATNQAMVSAAQSGNGLCDIQIDVIKTYLFLKIGCGNKPHAALFSSDALTSLELNDSMMLSGKARSYLSGQPASLALRKFALQKEDGLNGEMTDMLWHGTSLCSSKPFRIRIRNICGDGTEFVY